MEILICKALLVHQHVWVYGYPAKVNGAVQLWSQKEEAFIDIRPETICYSINATDINGHDLFIGDIVNDFGNAKYVPDTGHPNFHPEQAFPPMKQVGNGNRLGTIIMEDGTIRIETADIDFAYNISKASPFSEMEYAGNIYQ